MEALQAAAEAGNVNAMFTLAGCYFGIGPVRVRVNLATALAWYQRQLRWEACQP